MATPGQGNLEEQSREKMDKYIPQSKDRWYSWYSLQGFQGYTYFITGKWLQIKNNALKDSEKKNLLKE